MVSLLLESSQPSATTPSEGDGDGAPGLACLPEQTGRDLAMLFKLLADETRLRILFFLMQQEEINVRTFCRLLGQSQPAVSHHLAMLKEAGLLASRRDGKHNFYRVVPRRMQEFAELMFRGSAEQPRCFRLEDCVVTYERVAT